MNGPVHIYGLNAHGISACQLANRHGLSVSASDLKADPEFEADIRRDLPEVELTFGHHPKDKLEAATYVVVSPGVVQNEAMWHQVRQTPSWISVADFAWLVQRWSQTKIVITGTYGKTTFCTLLLAYLEKLGQEGVVTGNYQTPISDLQPKDSCTHLLFELDYQQLIATKYLQADAVVILNIHPDENVLGSDDLYIQTKLLAAELVVDKDKLLAPPHQANHENLWLEATTAGLLNSLAQKMGWPILNNETLEYLATRLPAGRQNFIQVDEQLNLINDGAAKGPGALDHLLPRLRKMPNPVLITHQPVADDSGLSIIKPHDAGAEALEEAIVRALGLCGKESSVLAYCPAISSWGEGLACISDRISLFEMLVRRNFPHDRSS